MTTLHSLRPHLALGMLAGLVGLPPQTVDDLPFPEPDYRPGRIQRVPYRAGYTPHPPYSRCRLKRSSKHRYTYVLKGCRP